MSELKLTSLFGIDMVNSDIEGFTNYLQKRMDDHNKSEVIFTPNVDHIVKIESSSALKKVYAKADYFIPDGMPLIWVSRLLGDKLCSRITGADLFKEINAFVHAKRKILIVGGREDDVEKTQHYFETAYPHNKYRIIAPVYDDEISNDDYVNMTNIIKNFTPDVIFVCLGFPKQEILALKLQNISGHNALILCVGAAIDFELGYVKRAPVIMQKAGFEWLWRLMCSPRRLFKRYLVEDMKFIKYVLLYYFKKS